MKKCLLFCVALVLAATQAQTQTCSAQAFASGAITCVSTSVTLSFSTDIVNPQILWQGPNGFTSNEAEPVVTQPGLYSLFVSDPLPPACQATASVTVVADQNTPFLSLFVQNNTCAGDPSSFSSITAIVSPGPPQSYQYVWSNGATGQQVTSLTPGAYCVTITGPNGCTASDCANVVQLPVLSVDITTVEPDCNQNNGQISLLVSGGTPPYLYLWANGSIGPSVPGLEAGTYAFTITDATGCTKTATVELIGVLGSQINVQAAITNNLCHGDANGAISLSVSGLPGPFEYTWTGPNGFSATGSSTTGLKAGLYRVVIEQNNQCATYTYVVAQPPPVQFNASVRPSLCADPPNGKISVNPTPGYTYQWSNGQNTATIQNLAPDTYEATITDPNGCTAIKQVTVLQGAPLTAAIEACGDLLLANASGGASSALAFSYLWQGPGGFVSTLPSATLPESGVVTLQVSDTLGCMVAVMQYVDIDDLSCGIAEGYVWADPNQNCQFDSGEPGMAGLMLELSNATGVRYALSDPAGRYRIPAPFGDYTLKAVTAPYDTPCPASYAIQLTPTNPTAERNFHVVIYDPNCPDTEVTLTTPLLRRCFDNNYYTIQIRNNGPLPVNDAYVELSLDPFLELLHAPFPTTLIGPNTYHIDIGSLAPFQTRTFNVKVRVSCSAALGQTHCSEAVIYPNAFCPPPDPNWSGAELRVSATCQGDSLAFELRNVGSAPMTQNLEYIVIEDVVLMMQGGGAPLGAGKSMTVKTPANGATWRIEAKQEPLFPGQYKPELSVEGCANSGNFTTGILTQFSFDDADPWVSKHCRQNQGAWDPNDKQGFPTGYGAHGYIRPDTEIEYLIRFQNTGTDTAFNVLILDTLSPLLDPRTLLPGPASHAYVLSILEGPVLQFAFPNIMLPDSNVNEPASNGFVQYRIRPRADAPLESDIFNSAAIYFDFNDPIITNTTAHRLGINFIGVRAWTPSRPEYRISASPNPVSAYTLIEISGAPPQGDYRLLIYSPAGSLLGEHRSAGPQFSIAAEGIPSGLALFVVQLGGAAIGSGRLIVEH